MQNTVEIFNFPKKIFRNDASNEEERVRKCVDSFRSHLEHLNIEGGKKAWDILVAGKNAMIGHMTYERVADNGPKKGAVTEKEPLTCE